MADDVSLATVAARAGVSVSTVSRIVNGERRRASPETVARVLEAIEAVGYRPNPVGRALRRGQSQLVAMLAAAPALAQDGAPLSERDKVGYMLGQDVARAIGPGRAAEPGHGLRAGGRARVPDAGPAL